MVDEARRARPRPDVRPHLLLHAGRPADPRHRALRRARRHPVRRLGADQPRPRPARRRRHLGPRPARPVDPRLHPAARPVAPEGRRRTGPTRSAPGSACVGYLTMPSAGGAIAHVHVNWLSPTKIRQMVIGGSAAHPGLGRPQPAAAAQRLRPWRRPRPQLRTDDRRRPTGGGHRHYRLGDMYAPALPEGEALGGDGDRVRSGHPRGSGPAHRRPGRAAGARRPRGGRRQPRAPAGRMVPVAAGPRADPSEAGGP